MDSRLTFDIDQNKVILASYKEGEAFGDAEGGIYFKAGEAENLVTQWTQHFTATDVKDSGLFRLGSFQLPSRF